VASVMTVILQSHILIDHDFKIVNNFLPLHAKSKRNIALFFAWGDG
jgi:hypothetical protein